MPKGVGLKLQFFIKILTATNYFCQKIDGGTTIATVMKVVGSLLDILKGMGLEMDFAQRCGTKIAILPVNWWLNKLFLF